MGENGRTIFEIIYDTFKISSILFRTLHVGMTMVDDVQKLFITESFDTMAHDIVPRTLTLDMTPENKMAAEVVKGIVNIEKNLITRMSTNVLTLDRFGTYDRNIVVAPEVTIIVPDDFTNFESKLYESIGVINGLLMSKGSLTNKFSMQIVASEPITTTIKQDEKYNRTLSYQDLVLPIEPEMFQLLIKTNIVNANIIVDFSKPGSTECTTVIQVPFKMNVHNSIVKIAGMSPTKAGILTSGMEFDRVMGRLKSFKYDTIKRMTTHAVQPSLSFSPTVVEKIFKDPEKGTTLASVSIKCVNSTVIEGTAAIAHIYDPLTNDTLGKCDDSSVVVTMNPDKSDEFVVTFDATKIDLVTELTDVKVELSIGYTSDNNIFRDSLIVDIPVEITMTEHSEIVDTVREEVMVKSRRK